MAPSAEGKARKGDQPELRWQGYDRSGSKYRARISLPVPKGQKAQRPALGAFETEEEAASAYNEALMILGRAPVNKGLNDVDTSTNPPKYLGLPMGSNGHRHCSLIRADAMCLLRQYEGAKQARDNGTGSFMLPSSIPRTAAVACYNGQTMLMLPLGTASTDPPGPLATFTSPGSQPNGVPTSAIPRLPSLDAPTTQPVPRTITTNTPGMPNGAAHWEPATHWTAPPAAPQHWHDPPTFTNPDTYTNNCVPSPPADHPSPPNDPLPSTPPNSLQLPTDPEPPLLGSVTLEVLLQAFIEDQQQHSLPLQHSNHQILPDTNHDLDQPGSAQLITHTAATPSGAESPAHNILPPPTANPLDTPYSQPPSWAMEDITAPHDTTTTTTTTTTTLKKPNKRNLKQFKSPFQGTHSSGPHSLQQAPQQAASDSLAPARELIRIASSRSNRQRLVVFSDMPALFTDMELQDEAGNPVHVESLASGLSLEMSQSLGALMRGPAESATLMDAIDAELDAGSAQQQEERQLLQGFRSLGLEPPPAAGPPSALSLELLAGFGAGGASGFGGLSELMSGLAEVGNRAWHRSLSRSRSLEAQREQQQVQQQEEQPAVLSPAAQQRKRELELEEFETVIDEGIEEEFDVAADAVGGLLQREMLQQQPAAVALVPLPAFTGSAGDMLQNVLQSIQVTDELPSGSVVLQVNKRQRRW